MTWNQAPLPMLRKRMFAILLLAVFSQAKADEPAALAVREFSDESGRKITATLVAIDLTTVTLRREPDGKEFKIPIARLSSADQVFLAANRAALGKASAGGGPTPLAPRAVTGTEVAKAKRFAKEVLMDDRKGGDGAVFKWEKRPTLTLKTSEPELAEFGQKTYDAFCDAAGFTGDKDANAEITLCIGSQQEIDKLKQSLAPGANRGGRWTWHYRWVGGGYKAFVFFVPEQGKDAENRRQVFRGIAAVFGCPGSSDEFSGSAFHSKSEAAELSPIDRQLVRLVHTQLDSRAGRDKLLQAVEKNWASMVAPAKPAATP